MFNLNKAVRKWRKSFYHIPSLEDGMIEELESHLRDIIKREKENGLTDKAAFDKAATEIGDADSIGREYFKTDTRGLSGRPPWTRSRYSPALWWNYLKLSLRKIRKQKGYAVINLAGLAIGMASCILIFLWISDELSFDRFYPNADNLVRCIAEDHRGGQIKKYLDTPSLLGPTLKEEFPEVVNACRMQCGWTNYWLRYEDKNFMEERLCTTDPTFFEMFPFSFIHGDPKTALQDRFSVVLTETLARKCFGDENPMGKIMKLNDQDMTVTGVIKDPPSNSTLQFDYCFPAENMTKFRDSKLDTWTYAQFATYLELREGVNRKELENKITLLTGKNLPQYKGKITLQRMTDIHLKTVNVETWTVRYPNPGTITTVYIFGLVAFCILLIACINFMNLMTARSSQRAKEVGLRKVTGAHRRDLIKQFYGETLLMTFFSLSAAIVLVQIVLPAFNRFAGKQITLGPGHLPLLGILTGVAVVTGLLAGSYPALYLSSFEPTFVMKNLGASGRRRSGTLRRGLVVFQFAVTSVLLILTSVIYSQLSYIQHKDLGYDQKNIITLPNYGQFGEDYEAVKAEMLQHPGILKMSRSMPPSQGFGRTTDVDWEGKDPEMEAVFGADMGDYDYVDLFGMTMVEGRYYSKEYGTDPDNFVINETAARLMGPDSVVGKRFSFNGKTGVVIGVVKDYHGTSLRDPITPKIIRLGEGFFVCFKFQGPPENIISFLEKKWKTYVGEMPFRYGFIDEGLAKYYESDKKISLLLRNFTGLAVFIACLGILGLAAFTSEQRTKEIGIRKVLGARISSLTGMLAKDFAKWVVAANLIAWPLAYYLASRWLQSFTYRTGINWLIFALTMGVSLAVTLLTVGSQALRAAAADPIKSLRYE